MKIGILTHQYINNYGAFLQAWALREAIAELFPNDEVQIIDYVNLKHFIINAGGWFRFYKNRESFKDWMEKIKLPRTFAKARNQEMILSKRCFNAEKFRDDADKRLVGVYIDITGNKEIYKRPEMVHLLKDCKKGAVNLIFSQTRAYLAANTCDFCFLLKYLFDMPMRVDVVTDDDDQRIDTILNVENQRQNLKELAEKYTSIRRKDYLEWRIRLEDEMTKAEEK